MRRESSGRGRVADGERCPTDGKAILPQQRLKALAVRFIVPLDELRAERFAAAAAGDGGGQRLLNLQRRDGFAIRDEQVFQLVTSAVNCPSTASVPSVMVKP